MISFQYILFLIFIGTSAQQQVPDFEIYQVEQEGRIELWGKNENVYPVTVKLDVERTNLSPNKSLPHTDVVSPKSSKKLAELVVDDARKAWEFSINYSYFMGDVFARHDDDYAYRLPFRLGTTHKVTQGYGGDFSHLGVIYYSLDFDFEEGTEIYAARSGVVIETEQSYSDGGATKEFVDLANSISIMHDDGSIADYSHLRKNGVRVQVGQRIRVGQLIGYSGATGFVTGPHLHFGVKQVREDGSYITIPIKFATRGGTVQLIEGQSYTAY